MAHSPRRRKLLKNRRGYSAIMATLFMVLAVLFLYFNVFMFMRNQDTKFQDAISQSQQMDADRAAEKVNIPIAAKSPVDPNINDQIKITCVLENKGPLPIQIVRLWVEDLTTNGYGNIELLPQQIILKPGGSTGYKDFYITIPDAFLTHNFQLTFVSSRGNLFPATINR